MDLVSTTSRHCRVTAIRSSAGNHWVACESPNSTTDVVERGFPYRQPGLVVPV